MVVLLHGIKRVFLTHHAQTQSRVRLKPAARRHHRDGRRPERVLRREDDLAVVHPTRVIRVTGSSIQGRRQTHSHSHSHSTSRSHSQRVRVRVSNPLRMPRLFDGWGDAAQVFHFFFFLASSVESTLSEQTLPPRPIPPRILPYPPSSSATLRCYSDGAWHGGPVRVPC